MFRLIAMSMFIVSDLDGCANDVCSDLGHSADPNEIEDLERFLEKTLPPEGDGQPSAGL